MNCIPIRQIQQIARIRSFSERFRIESIEKMLAGKPMLEKLHRHDFFYILALKECSGIHKVDFESFPVNNHIVYLLRPGQVHELKLEPNSRGYMLNFYEDFVDPTHSYLKSILLKLGNRSFYQFNTKEFKRIDVLLGNTLTEFDQKSEGYKEVIKSNLCNLVIELVRNKNECAVTSVLSYEQERYYEFKELLEKHIRTTRQVSDYSDMMNITSYKLNTITKEVLNKTCSELINEAVVLEAKRNVLATTKPINQIAFDLGYQDASYFVRFFKNHTGYTPLVFRDEFHKSTI
ncbi:MAG: helix-turn-helix domain-containing protein [Bacteroidota bacterium]